MERTRGMLADEKNEKTKEMVRSKVSEYMARVEYLKGEGQAVKDKRPTAVGGVSTMGMGMLL